MTQLKCLVTGGLGFIGSKVSSKLVERGHDVVVLDNFSNAAGLRLVQESKSIKVVNGDILDLQFLDRLVAETDVVVNLAVRCLPESIENPIETHMVNDVGALNVCMACKSHRKRLVHISSSEAYGTAKQVPMAESHPLDPTTPYGASKAASEMVVRGFVSCYEMEAVILRPFNTYGPYMREDSYSAVFPRFVARARSGERLIIFGDGRQTRDFTHVEDTAEGITRTVEIFPSGETLNLARGEETSILELARVVLAQYSSRGKSRSQSIEFQAPRQGDVRRHFADVKKARKLLGYEARVGLEQGVKKYAKWFEETHSAH